MDNRKYIGMNVHQASISIAVSDSAGKVLMECVIGTKAATVLEFIQGLRGSLWVTFEEGTSATWLYDLAKNTGVSLGMDGHRCTNWTAEYCKAAILTNDLRAMLRPSSGSLLASVIVRSSSLRRSKTDQEGEGRKIAIPVANPPPPAEINGICGFTDEIVVVAAPGIGIRVSLISCIKPAITRCQPWHILRPILRLI